MVKLTHFDYQMDRDSGHSNLPDLLAASVGIRMFSTLERAREHFTRTSPGSCSGGNKISRTHWYRQITKGDSHYESDTCFHGKQSWGELSMRILSVAARDRKSTRLNSSHGYISYAVFCLKKKKKKTNHRQCDITASSVPQPPAQYT